MFNRPFVPVQVPSLDPLVVLACSLQLLFNQSFLLIKYMKSAKCLSPTKQNLSPAPSSNVLNELLQFIKESGVKLPSHLQKLIPSGNEFMLKAISTNQQNCDTENAKKLRVKLGDAEFELKKIEEDFAHFKLSSRLQKQKEVRKWEQAYNQLKSNLQCSNEDSALKIIKLREALDKEVQSLKTKHETDLKSQKSKLTKEYKQKNLSLLKQHEKLVAEITENKEKDMQKLILQNQKNVKDMKEAHEGEMRRMALKYKQQIESKQKMFEGVCTALQSQKRTEQKLHQSTKIEASQAKQKLYGELYYERNMKKNIQEALEKREAQIKCFKLQVHNLKLDVVIERQKFERRQKELIAKLAEQKLELEQQNNEKMLSLLCSHKQQLSRNERTLKEMQQISRSKEQLMQQKYEQVASKFNERPSRKQDLDVIEKLKSKIFRKEEENKLLNRQLKTCVLDSQNKEQTYNKIFTNTTKLEKKTLSKDRDEFKSKESLCRKSQTTDIKFLLKVYNKHL